MNSSLSILQPWVYQEEQTLQELIERFCNPSYKVRDWEIANLIVKYFFNYIFPGNHNIRLSESDINKVFNESHFFFDIMRKWEKELGTDEPLLFREIGRLEYQLAMLWDVASTIVLFKDIIHRRVDDILWGGKYFWLDIGTGSGILLLAQYIQARRNGFTSFVNTGVELNHFAFERTQEIVQALGIWNLIYGNSYLEETYESVRKIENISFLSSENLTPSYVCLYDGEKIKEPFFENFVALAEVFWPEVVDSCKKFPERVSFVLGIKEFVVWPKFVDFSKDVVEHRETIEHLDIASKGMSVCGRFYDDLGKIWENYRVMNPHDRWRLVTFFPEWKHRWRKRTNSTM